MRAVPRSHRLHRPSGWGGRPGSRPRGKWWLRLVWKGKACSLAQTTFSELCQGASEGPDMCLRSTEEQTNWPGIKVLLPCKMYLRSMPKRP
ncbi:Serine Protease 33 [Manis pentadactyla]|nr:Serine Protease 33 [Manis pentadactyla]